MATESLAVPLQPALEPLGHCIVYTDRALAIRILDAETDDMPSHAVNMTSAALAVVRAAGQCGDGPETRTHLASLLAAAEILGALSLACSEEAEHVGKIREV